MSLTKLIVFSKMLEKQMGEASNLGDATYKDSEGLEKYVYRVTYEKATLNMELVMNADGEVSGLFFKPQSYALPSYASNMVYGKEKLKIISDTFILSAELILPENCDKCPVVVMVHGSGPSNMDEESGPNKVFYDLAMGLAAQGIASLRYDKRSFVYKDEYQDKNKQFDLGEETIDDAVAAVRALSQFFMLDTNKIAVLGHSLGGYAAPLIAQREPSIDRLILFAAPARPLQDVIVDQYIFLSNVDGRFSRGEKRAVKKQKNIAKTISERTYDKEAKAEELMVYWPGKWWESVEDYNPPKTLKDLQMPALVLQGESDYQVLPNKDFTLWQQELSSDLAKFRLYPGLNHLFIEGKGSMGPGQYLEPGNVSIEVIEDIANWLKK